MLLYTKKSTRETPLQEQALCASIAYFLIKFYSDKKLDKLKFLTSDDIKNAKNNCIEIQSDIDSDLIEVFLWDFSNGGLKPLDKKSTLFSINNTESCIKLNNTITSNTENIINFFTPNEIENMYDIEEYPVQNSILKDLVALCDNINEDKEANLLTRRYILETYQSKIAPIESAFRSMSGDERSQFATDMLYIRDKDGSYTTSDSIGFLIDYFDLRKYI